MATLSLYLIRHGIAAERGDAYPDDSKRPLTSAGITALRKEARGLVELDVTLDLIITSPLVRARQTADVIAQSVPGKPAVVSSDALAPAGSQAQLLQELARQRKGNIALVGHEPNLGELASRLLGAKGGVELKKGGVCRIDFEVLPPKGLGTLKWLTTPKMLRKLA